MEHSEWNYKIRITVHKLSKSFIENDKTITNLTKIANGFNNFFVNIGPTLANDAA